MSAFPPGYSDPSKTQYGSLFDQPPQPVAPAAPNYSLPPPQYGQPFTAQSGTAPVYPPTALQYGQPITAQPGTDLAQLQAQQLQILQQNPQLMAQAHANSAMIAQMMDPNNPSNNQNPVRTKCPSCQNEVMTETSYVVGSCTYLWCILLAFFGFILCCWFPFLWNGSKDVIHTCPNCKAECGRYVRQQPRGGRVGMHVGGRGHRHRRRRRRR